jgi:hypothetical protein
MTSILQLALFALIMVSFALVVGVPVVSLLQMVGLKKRCCFFRFKSLVIISIYSWCFNSFVV